MAIALHGRFSRVRAKGGSGATIVADSAWVARPRRVTNGITHQVIHPAAFVVRGGSLCLGFAMNDVNEGPFHEGQPIWVIQGDGSQRAAEYVGEGELSAWFGGSPTVIVVFPDDHSGAAVEIDRVIPRHAPA